MMLSYSSLLSLFDKILIFEGLIWVDIVSSNVLIFKIPFDIVSSNVLILKIP